MKKTVRFYTAEELAQVKQFAITGKPVKGLIEDFCKNNNRSFHSVALKIYEMRKNLNIPSNLKGRPRINKATTSPKNSKKELTPKVKDNTPVNISKGEFNIPIIALSQLSRAVETRKESNKMPQLSDLRESGAIEQDADMVMFIYRPEYYEVNANENGESTKGETHIRIAKHRNGSLELIKLRALLHIQKFAEWDGNDNIDGMMGGGSWKPITPSPIGGGSGSSGASDGGGKFFVQGSKMNSGDFDEGFDGDAPF